MRRAVGAFRLVMDPRVRVASVIGGGVVVTTLLAAVLGDSGRVVWPAELARMWVWLEVLGVGAAVGICALLISAALWSRS